jgi:hypothetical protein
MNRLLATAVAALLLASPPSRPRRRSSRTTLYKNRTNLNKKYPHGLGRVGARDHTSGTPVTNFKRSTKLYKLAMSYNRGLDRDKDGIACEKA